MKPGRYDMTAFKGRTFSVGISGKTDVPFDYSPYTDITLKILPSWDTSSDVAPLLTISLAGGNITKAGDGLSFSINMSTAETDALDFTEARYILDLVKPGVKDPYLYGKFTVFHEGNI